jgi:hypothetical protein
MNQTPGINPGASNLVVAMRARGNLEKLFDIFEKYGIIPAF